MLNILAGGSVPTGISVPSTGQRQRYLPMHVGLQFPHENSLCWQKGSLHIPPLRPYSLYSLLARSCVYGMGERKLQISCGGLVCAVLRSRSSCLLEEISQLGSSSLLPASLLILSFFLPRPPSPLSLSWCFYQSGASLACTGQSCSELTTASL